MIEEFLWDVFELLMLKKIEPVEEEPEGPLTQSTVYPDDRYR